MHQTPGTATDSSLGDEPEGRPNQHALVHAIEEPAPVAEETAVISSGGDTSLQLDFPPNIPTTSDTTASVEDMLGSDGVNVDNTETPIALTLVDSIPGLYPMLDLVSEHGSDGLGKAESTDILVPSLTCDLKVDKIIIAQESFGRFVNDICPNAYQSMTHVNFAALDRLSLRPLGLYGSRSEIVRYLEDRELVTSQMYDHALLWLGERY